MPRQTRTLEAGDPRRIYDARNAWRKMTPEQRRAFLDWLYAEDLPIAPAAGSNQ